MSNDAVKNELEELLKSCGFKEDDKFDFSDYQKTVKKDYDGTPIIGEPVKVSRRGRPRKFKEPVQKTGKKDGRGRPQNKTINFHSIDTKEKKLAILMYVVVEKFSQEFVDYMFENKLFEIVYLPTDGYSSCDRIRLYVGKINSDADGRDKAKGRFNHYERKGVFPMKDLLLCLVQFHDQWSLTK